MITYSCLDDQKGVTPKYSLKPLVPSLSELLGVEVKMENDCIGAEVEKLVAELPDGGILLLENVRFYKEEEKNDPEFAKKLASLADVYVNDAFGTAHRAHASTEGVAKFLKPSVAGFLMQKAQKYPVGSSLVEEDKLDLETSLLEKAKAKGVSLLLPTDVVIADKFAADANSKAIAKKLAELSGKGGTTIIGGGDSVAAVEKVGLAEKMSHISTGGGASLKLLEGKQLPEVLALDDA
ncbi:Phosphoglycerate kinase, cytosolic [Hibiscus syriacus]|uniref:phosphoglycerate kinase n=1 Tax=Hibiscus syriacus TaxID=106335 RepID=A0A6A3CC31_HIBSY|nr:Phosphoglycerate kinase, cytosolic [Hibiscus syriacus]